ncbi:MAG: hypothetical protein QOJ97_667 [Solirubrobacteraceae bacterium]|jgi:hypothetical protein|nr:hypothetical protein [Solirubrobacteraceae bacterium]
MTTLPLRGRRREIASLLSEKPRTLYETAKAMGKPSGAIYRIVHRMVDDGVLDADPNPPTRGTLFSLSDVYRERLHDGLSDDQATGVLVPNQRVVLVSDLTPAQLYGVIEHTSLAACIGWLVELEAGSTFLLGLHLDVTMLQAHRLAVALERSGGDVKGGRIGEILAGDALRRAAATMDELTTVT